MAADGPKTSKPKPSLPARIEADVGRDLRAVGRFAKGLLGVAERAESITREVGRSGRVVAAEMRRIGVEVEGDGAAARAIARGADGTEVLPACDVCGDEGVVGGARKVPCPACGPKKEKR